MSHRSRCLARPLALAAILCLLSTAAAPAAAAAPQARGGEVSAQPDPLRVHLVIHRSAGGGEAALPYSFLVGEHPAKVRVGLRVAIPSGGGQNSSGAEAPAFRYQEVGTSIDCSRDSLGDGRYRLRLAVETTSMTAEPEDAAPAPWQSRGAAEGAPPFRTFAISLEAVLADGESTRAVTATDPLTGEKVEIELRLEAL